MHLSADPLWHNRCKVSKYIPSQISFANAYKFRLQMLTIACRAKGRLGGISLITEAGMELWIAMAVLPCLSIGSGLMVNAYDDVSYRRYLQFLRLEFDTRLGMHSPR